MKILYVIDSLRAGGKERRLIELLKRIHEFIDVEIELVIMSNIIHYQAVHDFNVNIHFFPRNFIKDICIFDKFYRVLRNFNPDLVHCWDNIAAFHFSPICKIKGIPFINSMITAAPKTKIISKRFFFNALSYPFSDIILSNSQAGLDNLFVPKKKQRVIYNGFDFSRLLSISNPEQIRNFFKIKERFVVIMVASFTNNKDYNTFLKSSFIVREVFPDTAFLCIGDGSMKSSLQKKFFNPTKNNGIYFLGKQHDVESIINISDIGVLMTNNLVHGEGVSNSIIEYMAFAKPVIATRGGGNAEIVIDGETGLLIEAFNSNKLAHEIVFLLKNEDERKRMGKNGKDRIKNNFTIDMMTEETVELYKLVINK